MGRTFNFLTSNPKKVGVFIREDDKDRHSP